MQPQPTPSTQLHGRGTRLQSVAAIAATLALLLAMTATPATADEGDVTAAEDCSSGARTLSKPGDRVYPEMGNGGYVSEHTDLRIAYDTATNLFLPGTRADLVQRATQCLSDFSLDFERTNANANGPNMTVSSVQVNGVDVAFTFKQPTYPGNPNGPDDPDPAAHAISNVNPVSATNPNPPACSPSVSGNSQNGQQCPANKLVIIPVEPIPTGTTYMVTVNYTGRPGVHIDGDGSTEGWFRINTAAAPNDGSFVTTEPVGSMAWMPVNNHPSAKPTYDVYDTVPIGKTAIAAGDLETSSYDPVLPTSVNPPDANFPAGSWTWHWHSPERISNYLVTNSIGSYDLTATTGPLTGIRFYTAIASGLTAARKTAIRAVTDTQDSIVAFQQNFAGPYPFTTGGVIVALPSVGFAEEMQTKITFGNGATSTPGVGTFHHEYFHQWFGDNVSEAAFNLTFWKEGWATIGEYLNTARTAANNAGGLGTPAGDAAFDTSLNNRFNTNYGTTSTTFWTSAPSNPTVGNLFSTASTYTRPGTAYLALRQILDGSASRPASDRWINAMKQIQTDFRGSSITEQQLEDVFHSWLPNQSAACHSRLNDFFTQWFDTAYPTGGGPANRPTITGLNFYNDASACTRAEQTITFDPADKVYGDADFAVSATSTSGLPVTFSGDGDCTVTGATVHLTGAGSCALTASQAGDSVFAPASVTRTIAIAPAGTSTSVSVTPQSPNAASQFSDTVTVSATVTPDATATGDGVFAGTLSFQLNGQPVPALTTPVSNLAPTQSVEIDLGAATVPNGSGSYPVTATFVPDADANYAGSTDSDDAAVRKEGQRDDGTSDGSTRLDLTGDRAAAPGAAPNLIASLRQSLAPEAADTDYVDFGTSDVFAVFNIYPASCGAGCTATPAWTSGSVPVDNRSDWGDTGTGFAQVTGPSGLSEGAYVVTVSLVSNGYIVAERASSPLSVASPGERFVTGRGSVPDGAFSFDVKGAKSSLKGSSVYTYRTVMDGHDVVVTITSAGLTGLSTGTATTYPMAAFVTGAAVVQVVDAVTGQRYAELEPDSARFRLDLTDKGSSGKTDTYGFTAYRSDGTVFHQAHVGALPQDGTGSPSNQVQLSSGNVAVHPK
jgi:hypothetical protein